MLATLRTGTPPPSDRLHPRITEREAFCPSPPVAEIRFDQQALPTRHPTDAVNTLSNALTITANATPGRVRVSAFGAQAIAGAGTLLNLKLNVMGASGTALTWQRFIFNETPVLNPANGRVKLEFNGLDIPYGFAKCAVVVQGGDNLASDDRYLGTSRPDRGDVQLPEL